MPLLIVAFHRKDKSFQPVVVIVGVDVHVLLRMGLRNAQKLLARMGISMIQKSHHKLQTSHQGLILVIKVGVVEIVFDLGLKKKQVVVKVTGKVRVVFDPQKGIIDDLYLLLPGLLTLSLHDPSLNLAV